ncbi:MAG TPA: hypothetical protein VJ574_02555 [Candidatus Bathyarchaeia archaeon]|nr:hypothetical protein [Candidatus Bathyarchaeia archaeon]
MVSVVLSHVIGTIALLLVFVSAVTYSSMSYSLLGNQVVNYNLEKISGHIVSEVTDIVSLCSTSGEDQMLVKALEVPEDVTGIRYMISITVKEDRLTISSVRVANNNVFGVAPLPWSSGGSVKPFNGTDPGIGISWVTPKLSVVSSAGGLAVWCLKKGSTFTFGLGVMNVTGGA